MAHLRACKANTEKWGIEALFATPDAGLECAWTKFGLSRTMLDGRWQTLVPHGFVLHLARATLCSLSQGLL